MDSVMSARPGSKRRRQHHAGETDQRRAAEHVPWQQARRAQPGSSSPMPASPVGAWNLRRTHSLDAWRRPAAARPAPVHGAAARHDQQDRGLPAAASRQRTAQKGPEKQCCPVGEDLAHMHVMLVRCRLRTTCSWSPQRQAPCPHIHQSDKVGQQSHLHQSSQALQQALAQRGWHVFRVPHGRKEACRDNGSGECC